MRGGRRALAGLTLLMALVLGSSLAWATPGDPDEGFGTLGVVTTDVGGDDEIATGIGHQSDGSIVVVASDENTNIISLVRYQPDGSLDAGFGSGGILDLPGVGLIDSASRLLIGDDDSIFVVGSTFQVSEWNLLVWKLTPDGAPDTGFGGGDGHVVSDLAEWDFATGAVIDGLGRIVVVGRTRPDSPTQYNGLVARFTPAGVLDSSFSGDGWDTLDGGAFDAFTDVVVDASNRPVVTGITSFGGGGLTVARFTTSGSPDATFAPGGYVVPVFPDYAEGLAIDIDDADRFVVGGRIGTDHDVIVARLTAAGALDPAFGGGDGHFIRDFDGYVFDSISDLEVVDDGTIVAVGLAGDGGLVARVTSAGALDPTFSTDGYDLTDVTDSSESLGALSLDAEGRVVAAGYFQDAGTGHNDLFVVRYLLEEPPAPTTTTTIPEDVDSFDDDNGSVHEADIETLAATGITRGCGERLFCPRDPVTRGQMAAFLVRAFGLGAPSGDPDTFTDDDESVFEGDIEALAASGITRGCAGDAFCPDDPVTRGQMAAFLVRALGLPDAGDDVDTFADDNGSVFEGDIEALAASGITRGCASDSFCPDDLVTREQMASFLVRALATLED